MSLVVNERLTIDAGSIGLAPIDLQRKIEHILLTHSHLDHLATLAIFLDNVYVPGPDCPHVHAIPMVQQAVCESIFNGAIWPDLMALSKSETPFLKWHDLAHQVPVQMADLHVTPVSVDHVVPTLGFIIDDGESAFAFVSDTCHTDAIWQVANETKNLKMAFVETSFPNRMAWLAEQSKHLTPDMMRSEIDKLKHDVPIVIVHTKPAFRDEIRDEIAALNHPALEMVHAEHDYVI